MKRTIFSIVLFAALARADGIPFSGTALVGNAQDLNFSMIGPGLSLFQNAPDGPGGGIIACTPGTVCNFNFTIGVGIFDLNCVCTGGSFEGKTAGFLIGFLTFTGSAFVPANSTLTVVLPVTLNEQMAGYQLIFSPDTGYTLGAKLFAINATGSGILSASQINAPGIFNEFSYTFTGTAHVVPEPATWLFVASGFLAIAAANVIRRVRSRVTT